MSKKALFLALLVASTAFGQQRNAEPINIKGIDLKTTLEEFKQHYPSAQCMDTENVGCVVPNQSFAGKQGLSLGALFIGGKVAIIGVRNVRPDDYSDIVDALTEKYGKPAKVETPPLQNRMGAKFENVVTTWKFPDALLIATKMDGKITEGSVRLQSLSGSQKFEEEKKLKAKQAASDT